MQMSTYPKTNEDLLNGQCDGTDEFFVLYESDDCSKRIVLFRNQLKQIEYILMSPCLTVKANKEKIIQRNFFMLDEYFVLLEHQPVIIRFLNSCDERLIYFRAFFGMTVSQFFNTISKP